MSHIQNKHKIANCFIFEKFCHPVIYWNVSVLGKNKRHVMDEVRLLEDLIGYCKYTKRYKFWYEYLVKNEIRNTFEGQNIQK